MDRYGEMFPENPRDLEELVDSLVRRATAAQRLLGSLTDGQRDELAALMEQTLQDAGLAAEMSRLSDALRARRPEMDQAAWSGDPMTGDEPLGLSDATSALADLADLADLESELRQDYPGARLDDIDEAAVRRALGRQAVDDMEALRQTERELETAGLPAAQRGPAGAHPQGGAAAGRDRAAPGLRGPARGRLRGSRAAGRGAGRGVHRRHPPLAVRRRAGHRRAGDGAQRAAARGRDAAHDGQSHGVRLSGRDFEVGETQRRASAAVCLLVDLSYSMALRGTWGAAKQTALALHALVRSRFPQDSIQVIGFSNYARELRETDLAGLGWDMVQGTNLHHALVLAGRYLDRRPEHDPVVLIVTDGEPTAHLRRDGRSWFDWPPAPETIQLTLAEVDKMTRRHASLNVFMLAEDERLTDFVNEVARRNGGRVLNAVPERLGEFVVRDFLRTRREARR